MTALDPASPMDGVEVVDVVIVGGGPAGLSAALALGRSQRSVIVVDAGQPRNAPSAHMHGVLGHDGLAPSEFLALGRADVAKYGVTITAGTVRGAQRVDDATFSLELDTGQTLRCRRILVTSGVTDELPDIEGLWERWGIDVIHCPYCHGWEVRDKKIAVIATGPMGVHVALMFRQLSSDVTLCVHSGPAPTGDVAVKLAALGIRVLEGSVDEVLVTDGALSGLRLASAEVLAFDAVVVAPRAVARSVVLDTFGVERAEHPLGREVIDVYAAQKTGQTSVPGLWATGNVIDGMGPVASVVADGYMTGAMLNMSLIEEDAEVAVAAFTAHQPHHHDVMDEAFWDGRYATRPQLWSGNPNRHLVSEVTGLPPGTALDVGAGEGADAIWLAEHGWTVTANDISATALERGRAHAATLEPEIADRITWQHGDALAESFPGATYDLVSSQFIHVNPAEQISLFSRCAAAVNPGGHLLIVAHHPSDMNTTVGRPRVPELFYSAEQIAELLDGEWTVLVQEARPRNERSHHHGGLVTIRDTVLLARKSPRSAVV